MVQVTKHEWHRVDSQFVIDIDEDLLSSIYPDLSEEEITELLNSLTDGSADIDAIINDASDNSIDLEWEREYDDWYTERKGGFEVTYELTAPETD